MVPWPKDQGSFVAAFGQPNGSYNGRSWNTAGVSRAGSSHNKPYVNPFVRGLAAPARLRKSSIVKAPGLITRIVVKPTPVASEFDWIPSPCSDGFR